MEINNQKIAIEIIDTAERLSEIVEGLKRLPELSVDTEFDQFSTQYGVHLQLIQVFDGINCYLIDPLKIADLGALWAVFEDENICKVLYSGSADVDILKRYGCNIKNVFDIQIASFLCNRSTKSYSELIKFEFAVEIDKTLQRSRWGDRPLEAGQLVYASNDVIYLLHLKALFLNESREKKVLHMLEEENIILESTKNKEYEVKLTKSQKWRFNLYAREKLMDLKNLVNSYAKMLNVPLFYIVRDALLEEIVKDKRQFLKDPFIKGFHKDVIQDDLFKKQFLDIVRSIDTNNGWGNPANEEFADNQLPGSYSKNIELKDSRFLNFQQFVADTYGDIAVTVILRGVSKMFSTETIAWEGAKQYQRDLYKDYLGQG